MTRRRLVEYTLVSVDGIVKLTYEPTWAEAA